MTTTRQPQGNQMSTKTKRPRKGIKNTAINKDPKAKQALQDKRTEQQNELAMQSDLKGLRNPQGYVEFIQWLAIPSTLRTELNLPNTQQEMAKHLGVMEKTLVLWKHRAGFSEDVMRLRNLFFTARASDVILSLETKCLNPATVNGQDVRVYLTATNQYNEKAEVKHSVHPDVQKAIDRVAADLD